MCSDLSGTINTRFRTQRVHEDMTSWFPAIKVFYKWIIFLYIHWVVESVNIFAATDFYFCTPHLPEETRGFSFCGEDSSRKAATLITFPSVARDGSGRRNNQLILNRLGSEWGWNRQLHTHLPQKWWCREPAGCFLRPPPPSVKINKITIKKNFLVVTKAGFLIDSSERHKRRGESQLYQKWELIFDWIYGGKNCFKGGRVEICLYKN